MERSPSVEENTVKKVSLGVIGYACIVGAAVSHFVVEPSKDASEMLGQGIAQLVMVCIGVVLIIVHLVRRRR